MSDIVPFRPPIEGEYQVVLPPQSVAWSFWSDDAPRLAQLVGALVLAIFLRDWIYRLLP